MKKVKLQHLLVGAILALPVSLFVVGCSSDNGPVEKPVPPGSIPPPSDLPPGMMKKGGGK